MSVNQSPEWAYSPNIVSCLRPAIAIKYGQGIAHQNVYLTLNIASNAFAVDQRVHMSNFRISTKFPTSNL